jgi:hypothetical protein
MAGKALGDVQAPDQGDRLDLVVPNAAIFSPAPGTENYVWVIDPNNNSNGRGPLPARGPDSQAGKSITCILHEGGPRNEKSF